MKYAIRIHYAEGDISLLPTRHDTREEALKRLSSHRSNRPGLVFRLVRVTTRSERLAAELAEARAKIDGLTFALGQRDRWLGDIKCALDAAGVADVPMLALRDRVVLLTRERDNLRRQFDEAVEAAGAEEFETVVVSFGSPTHRQDREGFWEWPRQLPGRPGQFVELIAPQNSAGAWMEDNIRLTGTVGTILGVSHCSGYGGGNVTVRVAVPRLQVCES